ncbi:hypothetical protein V6N11_048223 [Hibiscus sabdariffa]|uniref:RNase H type-1 domain-containing protein n=1 Tax=Hibiscus sabdariffa TaxID=183260 RepID=A0ABR2PUK8_9ROSI
MMDQNGEWLRPLFHIYSRTLFYYALLLAWVQLRMTLPIRWGGEVRMVVHSECLKAFELRTDALRLLRNSDASQSVSSLLRHIYLLTSRDWTVEFQHVYREGNLVTDRLARVTNLDNLGVVLRY